MKDNFDIYKWKKKLNKQALNEATGVELPNIPNQVFNKFATQIRNPQTFAGAILGLAAKLSEKENEAIMNNPKLKRAMDILRDLAGDQQEKEVEESNGPFRGRVGGKPKKIKTKVDTYAGDGVKEDYED